jgi:Leucine-rich repeat (LRR) protein
VTHNPTSVVELWLQNNAISSLPTALAACASLELLYVNNNVIQNLDAAMASSWQRLQELKLSSNPRFAELPLFAHLKSCASWASLLLVHINNTGLRDLPAGFGSMVNLAQASLCGNAYLAVLPESIGQCTKLEKLFLNDNALTFLPESFGELRALSKLYVNGNKLRYLPNSLGNLATLEELYLGDNCLSALPPSLSSCSSLNKLFAIRNKIRNLPPSLPPSLELLNL